MRRNSLHATDSPMLPGVSLKRVCDSEGHFGIEILEARDLLSFGVEFLANPNASDPQVAHAADGSFIVVGTGVDGNQGGIVGQRFDASGSAIGSGFIINTTTTGDQHDPVVAMNASGEFVVAWTDGNDGIIGSGVEKVYAQRFDANGQAEGAEFLVSTTTNSTVNSIAMDDAGGFVVVFTRRGDRTISNNNPFADVYLRRYDSTGTALGAPVLVHDSLNGNQYGGGIGMDDDGNFVIAWVNQNFAPEGSYFQRFASDGTKVGTATLFTTDSPQYYPPVIGMDADGDFVLVWDRYESFDDQNVYAQRFSSLGTAQGSVFQVNSFTIGQQQTPKVAMDDDGDFVVTWSNYYDFDQDGDGSGVFAQRYQSDGTPISNEFQVNTTTIGNQQTPAASMDGAGNLVIAWKGPAGNIAARFDAPTLASVPTANAGSAQVIHEGDSISLDASASFDPDGSLVQYSWDVNGDGVFGDTTGISPTLTWAQLVALGIDDGPQMFDVRVRVTDDAGLTATSGPVTLTVNNSAPTVEIFGWNYLVRGQAREFAFISNDPSPVDEAAQVTLQIDWDGDGNIDEIQNGPATGISTSHVFTASGNYTIKVSVVDKDGGISSVTELPVTVVDWSLLSDPQDGSKQDLHWGGTNGIDAFGFAPGIVLTQALNNQFFASPQLTFLPSFNGKIYVYGQAGGDLVFADVMNVPMIVVGGDGDDVLIGGRAGDTLYGGNGNDIIFGGTLETDANDLIFGDAGDDIVVGHFGADELHGGSGFDLIVAGALNYGSNLPNAIYSIQAEWLSGRPMQSKVDNILGTGVGPRNNGEFFLIPGVTALDDSAVDSVLGEADGDWLLYDLEVDLDPDFTMVEDVATDLI